MTQRVSGGAHGNVHVRAVPAVQQSSSSLYPLVSPIQREEYWVVEPLAQEEVDEVQYRQVEYLHIDGEEPGSSGQQDIDYIVYVATSSRL